MKKMIIADYLAMRLASIGCKHIFGIPGTSCSDFFDAIDRNNDIEYILTSNELEAGYMADGYGRQGKLGAVCVSYGVGILSMANAVASALTEKIPMLILNGGPREKDIENERKYGVLFSHSTGRDNSDYEAMKPLCVESTIVSDFDNAARIIDELISQALIQNGPVYLEIPSDRWDYNISYDPDAEFPQLRKPSESADGFIMKLKNAIANAERPVVIVGSEIEKRGLQGVLLEWLEKNQIPFVTTLLSKANVYPENHDLFGGVYDSDLAPKLVRQLVEKADLVIAFGVVFGIDHLVMVKEQISRFYSVAYGSARVAEGVIDAVDIEIVIQGLDEVVVSANKDNLILDKLQAGYAERRHSIIERLSLEPRSDFLNFESVFEIIDKEIQNIDEAFILGVDTCLASYPAADISMPQNSRYLANPVWLSIGHGTPASVGAYFATGRRPIIITGDGGFQMVAQALSTMARYKVPAIVIVLNNSTYAIEQFLIEGSYFLDQTKSSLPYTVLNNWHYEKLMDVFEGGKGVVAKNVAEFKIALQEAISNSNELTLINTVIPARDLPAENILYLENQ